MEEKIPETEQWLLKGDCKKCRRSAYCGKNCKAFEKFKFDRIRSSLFENFSKIFDKKNG